MKVALAGYNIEHELAQRLAEAGVCVTPETISAAYARVSRSNKALEELHKEAAKDVTKARRSNQTIVFEMGHHSIAEHAVFNFDISGISRLATEALEHHRLNAYTERSQRYVTLTDDFVVPAELEDAELRDEFIATVKMQNRYYHLLYERLREYLKEKHPDRSSDQTWLENTAKEDARYITSLATQTQVGMTVNARNLELMIRRLLASELAELRELGAALYRQAVTVAPSLLVFTGVTDYEKNTYPRLREYAVSFMVPAFTRRPKNFIAHSASDVTLVDYTPNADNKLLAALMHTSSKASFSECMGRVERQTLARKKEIFKQAMQDLQAYDAVLREFEHLYLTFEITLSAACFAQLKRHRMMTITTQAYSPTAGWTVPVSIAEIKEHKNFKELLARTEDTYAKLAAHNPAVAQYVLTNAHQRRVLVTLNARELYHIARLREDMTAQWDIRDIAGRMVEQARHVMPLTLSLASGKDGYAKVYQELFGHPPAVVNLQLPEVRLLPSEEETKECAAASESHLVEGTEVTEKKKTKRTRIRSGSAKAAARTKQGSKRKNLDDSRGG